MGDPRRAQDILSEMRAQTSRPATVGSPAPASATGLLDPLLEQLTDIVATVLGVDADEVDPTVPFGQLGGDSLLAVRVLSQCRRAFGVELPLRALGPAVALTALAAALRQERPEPVEAGAEVPAPATVSGGELPLTSGARALAGLHALNPELPTYNVAVELAVTGALDRERLRRALDGLARRHEALRCTFHDDGGLPTARVMADPVTDYAERDATAAADEARRLVREAAETPLDLARTPLRARLIRTAVDRNVLVLVVHHAVCDGLSVRILLRDLTALYRDGSPDELPALTFGLADLARRSDERLAGGRRERLTDHWRAALSGAPELLQLPVERTRPVQQSMRGARVRLTLDGTQVRRLRALAAGCGGTLFSTLAAGLGLLLRRYTEQSDIVVGFPIANRADAETQDLVGYLSQTVPLRMHLTEDLTVAQLVAHAQHGVVSAYENADLPFDAIVAAVAPRRAPSYHPIFQVALVLLTGTDEYATVPGLVFQRRDLSTGTTKFDLSWYLEETADGLHGYVEYAADLFPPALVEQMVAHFSTVLDGLPVDPDRPATRVPLYRAAEHDRLIGEFTPTARVDHGDVHGSFERHAAERPDQPALWHAGRLVTYAEVNAAANRLARALRRDGIGAEDLVGICLSRSAEQIVALLAVLKAGAAYLPLDPGYPADRLRYMVRDAGVRYVIARSATAGPLSDPDGALRVIDPAAGDAEADGTDLGIRAHADSLAYVIYTSGSTGEPKGVELTHGGLANVIASSGPAFDIDAHTRVLQFVSFSFDASVWEIFMALARGATLCLGPADHADAEQSVEETIRACGATLVYLPPALLSVVDPARVPSVRLVITGGDRITAELRDRWLAHCRFFAAYGPTEGTIVQTWAECHAATGEAPSIGAPFANVRLYVLDHRLDPVPRGAVGEVCIGGLAVGRGYRSRPAMTAERFLPDPYGAVAGARLYRTGDLVRRRLSGELQFVGRVDHQVKIRGYRIELGEVEAALHRSPDVAEALVRAEPSPAGRPQLVAYVLPTDSSDAPDLAERLRVALRRTLPDHMVPSQLHLVPVFPLTVNGKVDVATLRTLSGLSRASLEELLAEVETMTVAQPEGG